MEELLTIFHTLQSAITRKDKWEKKLTDRNPYPETDFNVDHREMIYVEQYFLCEYVAIPKNFEIESVLKMRERVGLFDISGVDRKILDIIAMSTRDTPVFQMMNNPRMNITTCLYFLHILDKSGLIVEDIRNPFREDYTNILKTIHDGKGDNYLFMRGQETRHVNLVIFNLDLFRRKDFAKRSLARCEEMENWIEKIKSAPTLD